MPSRTPEIKPKTRVKTFHWKLEPENILFRQSAPTISPSQAFITKVAAHSADNLLKRIFIDAGVDWKGTLAAMRDEIANLIEELKTTSRPDAFRAARMDVDDLARRLLPTPNLQPSPCQPFPLSLPCSTVCASRLPSASSTAYPSSPPTRKPCTTSVAR